MKQIISILLVSAYITLCAESLPVYISGSQLPLIEQNTELADYIMKYSSKSNAALIIGEDLIAVGVTKDAFGKISFVAEKDTWNVKSDSLPAPVNIDHVKAIYLYNPRAYISKNNELRFQDIRNSAEFLGQAEKNGYIIWKYRIPEGLLK